MTKDEAIEILGGSHYAVARKVGLRRTAVTQWPELLPVDTAVRVIGAAALHEIPVSPRVVAKVRKELEVLAQSRKAS